MKAFLESKEIFKELWQTIQSKKTWHGVLKNKRKNGEFYFVNITIKPILDENNEILEYIAIRHEITDLIHKKSLSMSDISVFGMTIKLQQIADEYLLKMSAISHVCNIPEVVYGRLVDTVIWSGCKKRN